MPEDRLQVRGYNEGFEDAQRVLIGDTLSVPGIKSILDQVTGVNKLDQRMAMIARPESQEHPGDLVVFRSQDYSEPWIDYLASIGFVENENIITFDAPQGEPLIPWLLEDEEAGEEYRREVDERRGLERVVQTPYYSNDEAIELSRRNRMGNDGMDTETSLRFNDKVNFKRFCRDIKGVGGIRVPVLSGTVVQKKGNSEEGLEVDLRKALQAYGRKGRAYIRGSLGASASSSGLLTVDRIEKAVKWMMKDEASDEFLVEPYHDVVSSPSVLLGFNDSGVYFISGLSGQILDFKKKHVGNLYPLGETVDGRFVGVSEAEQNQLMRMLMRIGEEMWEEGYRSGVAGVDTIKIGGDHPQDYVPVECNARLTGASPIAYVKERIEERHGKVFLAAYNVDLNDVSGFTAVKEVLEGERILYDGSRGEGTLVGLFIDNLTGSPRQSKATMISFSEDPERLEHIVDRTTEAMDTPETYQYFAISQPWN